jgi:probable HAF family extracellular repeat protein
MPKLRSIVVALILLFAVPFTVGQTVVPSADITFTTIDVPGAGFTGVEGINSAGDMVGVYGETESGPYHAFLLQNGNFTFFDYPGASSTWAAGINDSGVIVGYTGDLRVHGFLYDGVIFRNIRRANDTATFTVGINNDALVVGGTGSVFSTTGFKLRNHRFQKVDPPGTSVYVYATGINNFGDVVGWTDEDGFVYQGGRFKTLRVPDSHITEAWGINDSGIVVGWYGIGASFYGFALKNGSYISIAYPGAKATFAKGINSAGQVVGAYTYDYEIYHGFVTDPITDAAFEKSGR